jgi:hypothetical protein
VTKEVQKLRDSTTDDAPLLHAADEEKRGTGAKLLAAALALLLTGSLVFGYFYLKNRNERQLASQKSAQAARAAVPPPEAQIFQDEVRLKGAQALVGGTVRNISGAALEDLSVEIELTRRADRATETRSVGVEPKNLAPGEDGKFSLLISPSEWAGTKVVRLRSGPRAAEVPFRPELGERRPAERAPTPKVVVVPRPRGKGDDFINTPDKPIRIP